MAGGASRQWSGNARLDGGAAGLLGGAGTRHHGPLPAVLSSVRGSLGDGSGKPAGPAAARGKRGALGLGTSAPFPQRGSGLGSADADRRARVPPAATGRRKRGDGGAAPSARGRAGG